MKIAVLVVTPTEGFGELIRQTLEETGQFRVAVVNQPQAVPDALARHHPRIVVLDGDIDPSHAGELLQALREQAPRVKVAFIPPENLEGEQARALGADALLDKPFYLPDLLAAMERLAQALVEEPEEPEPSPPWMADADQAAQHLARLTLESLAVASALVTRDGQLYAYAGQLPRLAAEELAQTVAYYWEAGGQADFARYMTLSAVQGEFMVYVTQVTRDVALAVLFESQTPFTRIREQAARLAQALSEIPAEASKEDVVEPPAQEPPEEDLEPAPPPEPEEDLPPEAFRPLFEDVPPPIPEDWAPGEALSPEQQAVLDALLHAEAEADQEHSPGLAGDLEEAGSADAPEAEPSSEAEAAEQGQAAPMGEVDDETPTPPAMPREEVFPQMDVDPAEAPTVAVSLDEAWSHRQEAPDEAETVAVRTSDLGQEETSPPPEEDEVPTRPAQTGEAEEPRTEDASPATPSVTGKAQLPPPATMARADLHYACVLIPRIPQHYLTGDLARSLNQWVRRICTAFGWRLTYLAVRPNYLHWVVQVLPNTSPAYAVRVIREHTSNRIFRYFPYLAHDNPSGDFWAPGYLVIGQPRPLERKAILEFIWEVRRRQGMEE